MKIKNVINLLLILGLVLPSFGFAQAQETLGEAKTFGMRILDQLPNAVKEVWREEALPLLQKMWGAAQDLWNTYIWPKIEPIWQKKKPTLEKEFQKEKEEMKTELPKVGKPLWERFKDLLK